MWRWVPRAVGGFVGGSTLVVAFFALIFAFDNAQEFWWTIRLDVVIGFVFAVCVVLAGIPRPAGTQRVGVRCG
jgi:hypothetical protein